MKIFLCLFLIQIYSCLGGNKQSSNNWREIAHDDENYGHHKPEPIERPCYLQDLSCIRQHLGLSSHCSAAHRPVHGPVHKPDHGPAHESAHELGPDRHRIKIVPMSIPHVNVTFVLFDADVEGLNDFRINEFYINKGSGNLVMEVEFRRLRIYAPHIEITFHRKGREPIVLADYGFIEYRDLSLTLTAPNVKDVKLSEAHVYTFISDAAPNYELGPNFTQSKEHLVRIVISRLVGNMGTSLQESFVTKGPILMSAFLQNYICRH